MFVGHGWAHRVDLELDVVRPDGAAEAEAPVGTRGVHRPDDRAHGKSERAPAGRAGAVHFEDAQAQLSKARWQPGYTKVGQSRSRPFKPSAVKVVNAEEAERSGRGQGCGLERRHLHRRRFQSKPARSDTLLRSSTCRRPASTTVFVSK